MKTEFGTRETTAAWVARDGESLILVLDGGLRRRRLVELLIG